MSLLDKLKNKAKEVKVEAEERQSFFDDVRLFKPATGDNIIRILPHWDPKKRADGESEFWVKRVIHYLPTKKRDGSGTVNVPFACLAQFDEDCPACSAFNRLRKIKAKNAGDLKPQERYLYNIIDYGTKDSGPELCVWAASFGLYTEIMEWTVEIDCEFWSLKKGRDWKLKKTVDKNKAPQFGTKYKMMPKPNDSAVPPKILSELDEKMTNLDEVWVDNDREKMTDAIALLGVEVEDEPKKSKAKARDEDEEEDERPKKKSKSRDEDEDERPRKKSSKARVEEEEEETDDEEEEDDEEESEEEDEAPKSKKSKPSRRDEEDEADDEEEDEGDDEEDDEEEEEEERPLKKAAKGKKSDDALTSELKRLGV